MDRLWRGRAGATGWLAVCCVVACVQGVGAEPAPGLETGGAPGLGAGGEMGVPMPATRPDTAPQGTLPTAGPAAPAEIAPADDAALRAERERAREALRDAEARVEQADADYSRARHNRRPRGAARQEIVNERMAARKAYADAQAALADVERRARDAGLE